MGNGVTRLSGGCCAGTAAGDISRRYDVALVHDGLGHSFCYVRPDPTRISPPEPLRADPTVKTTTFRSISGASVSANPSTALSTSTAAPAVDVSCPYSSAVSASAFESSDCFASLPLLPVPRGATSQSGPINPSGYGSGPFERRFLSGPIESGLFSGSIEKKEKEKPKKIGGRRRKFSSKAKSKKKFITFKSIFMNLMSNKISRSKKSVVEPINGSDSVNGLDSDQNHENPPETNDSSINLSSHENRSTDEEEEENTETALRGQDIQWAQGKAGEDRLHVVISEENGWVFVGIYDGFNGPDAPDYLLNNLYTAVHKELQGLLWNDKFEAADEALSSDDEAFRSSGENGEIRMSERGMDCCDLNPGKENCPVRNGDIIACDARKQGRGTRKLQWRCEWHNSNNNENDKKNDNDNDREGSEEGSALNHKDVLRALQQALKKTEEAYLEIADQMVKENPELALMGSCVLVMLMKGEDVYLMNAGDSRAVLAQKPGSRIQFGRRKQELERIMEDSLLDDHETNNGEMLFGGLPSLVAIQLTMEHSTRVEEEVRRIMKEHPDDVSAVENDRVKGYLKVTRAFGAGFLKQPKWNDALLEMFRINYVGTSPYITCSPSLYHHRLTSWDKFLILSSDGLYEYFSNEEVIFEVESFIAAFPEGDPAQHLIEEVLFRAAKKSGMDLHELLDIPQGDRRRYHDDVSVIIISLEGRIWRSSM